MQIIRRAFRPLLVTLFLVLAWFFTPLGTMSVTFVKVDAIWFPYSVIFYLLCFFTLLFFINRVDQERWWKVLLGAAAIGYVASFGSLAVATFLVPNGVESQQNALRLIGVTGWIGTLLVYTIVFAGWVVFPIAAALAKLIGRLFATYS